MKNYEIKNNFYNNKIFNLCDCLEIKNYLQKIGSNSGIYGWNWSAYIVGDFCLIDSYRNSPAKKALEFTKRQKESFKKLFNDWNIKHEQKQNRIIKKLLKILEKQANEQ